MAKIALKMEQVNKYSNERPTRVKNKGDPFPKMSLSCRIFTESYSGELVSL